MESPFYLDVYVKRTHILKGVRFDCVQCPHALAIKRAAWREMLKMQWVSVQRTTVMVGLDGKEYTAVFPQEVRNWIYDYDNSSRKADSTPIKYRLHFE